MSLSIFPTVMEPSKEHHLAFPPSANWYNFNASDLSLENKYFAYGAKNTVCVFEVVGFEIYFSETILWSC